MNKEFIPYEQALALKELRFDEPCFGCFTKSGELSYDFSDNKNEGHYFQDCAAPTFSQASRWFREKYKIISVISFYCNEDNWKDVVYEVTISEFKHFKTHDSFVVSDFKTYEKAELACLRKLIQLVKDLAVTE
jgi:hypothetical protein